MDGSNPSAAAPLPSHRAAAARLDDPPRDRPVGAVTSHRAAPASFGRATGTSAGRRSAPSAAFTVRRRSRGWFERIEELRALLAASADHVEVVNYGAGLRTSSRTDAEMRTGSVSQTVVGPLSVSASVPAPVGRQLHAIVHAVGVRRGIELGTCVGISAAYQASALQDAADVRFVTCEGAPGLAELARRNLGQLGLRRCSVVAGRFDDTLPAVSADLAPIDYAFVDGHHDEAATKRYFELLLSHAATRAVFVFDRHSLVTWNGTGMAGNQIVARRHRSDRPSANRVGRRQRQGFVAHTPSPSAGQGHPRFAGGKRTEGTVQ